MLSFVVFDADGIDARFFPPRHAYLHGPDELPLQADIAFAPGVVRAQHSAPHSTALVVQFTLLALEDTDAATIPGSGGSALAGAWRVDASSGSVVGQGLGVLTIATCLLPDRGEPYLLSIELARHRIMLFLNKLEDWGLTDLPAEHPVVRQFEHARGAFTRALVAQRDGSGVGGANAEGFAAHADKLAAQTVGLAVDASEGLALVQADRQIRERAKGTLYAEAAKRYERLTQEQPVSGAPVTLAGQGHAVLPGVAQVGVAVSPGQFFEPAQKFIQQSCDFVAMPMRWIDLEPKEGKYNFAGTDKWIEWAVRVAKVPIVGGPLVDFRPTSTPDWLYIWENDYETLRDLVVEHVQAVVTRYRRTVQRWTVCSGLHVNTNFKLSFEQIMDLTRICVVLVRKLHPAGKIQIEVAQPWGEYHAYNRRSLPPLLYAEALVQAGLNFDTLGLRVQMGHAQPGLSTRDMMALSAMLDRYAAFEKPLAVTAIGAPSGAIAPTPYQPRAGAPAESAYEPGHWRAAWSENQQAAWLGEAMAIAASKPYVHSVCWHELMDAPAGALAAEMPLGGLMNSAGGAKAAAARFTQLRQGLREGRSLLPLKV